MSAPGSYVERFEATRVDLLRRVMVPMWKRMGWEPRLTGPKDPLNALREYIDLPAPDGVVAVPLPLLKALYERKECGSLREFNADEDGPTSWTTYALCRIAEGHEGEHSNGYYRWKNTDARDRTEFADAEGMWDGFAPDAKDRSGGAS